MQKNNAKKGRIIPNGIRPEPHEMDAFLFLTNLGKTLELIVPSNTPHTQRPDFMMDWLEWELKSPISSNPRALERIFYSASNQSCNIIIDLRRIKGHDKIVILVLEKCFHATRKVRRMYIITKTQKLKFYKK